MARKAGWAIVAVLLCAGVALPNAGPPAVPKGHKVVEPPVRFEGTDKLADYVFCLRYRTVYFDCGHGVVEVKGSEPITLKFTRKEFTPRLYMVLLAVERREFEKRKKNDEALKWLEDAKDGVLSATLTPPETTAPADAKNVPVTTYHVTLKDGKLSAEKVEEKKSDPTKPSSFVPPWPFAVVASFSIAWFGIWFARRGVAPALRK